MNREEGIIRDVRKLATILILTAAAVLATAVAEDRLDNDTRVAKAPLIAPQLIPAGTPGERITFGSMYTSNPPRPEYIRREGVIYDPAYLRGRVAIVDILPGAQLRKAYFRRP